MRTAAILTLGCKVNQYDSQRIADRFREAGYAVVTPDKQADVYVINSCTVTAESTRKTRQQVRHFRNLHPESVIILTGCVPQAFPLEAKSITQADVVIGNRSNEDIVQMAQRFLRVRQSIFEIRPHEPDEAFGDGITASFAGHTRAFVKIQDGCDRFCSYCAIPYARGRARSKPIEDVRRELLALSASGYKEIVFVGINLSAYGKDLGLTLYDAVKTACETDGIERVRLGSLEPDHLTDELLTALSREPKFCPQFHISLQSGCDRILKKMNRRYSAEEFRALVGKIHSLFPDVWITTDVITGFPGETDEDFDTTTEFVKEIGFEKVHVFPFSEREGTVAVKLPDPVPKKLRAERAENLSAICAKIRREALSAAVGKMYDVLFETPKNELQCGHTAQYIPVSVPCAQILTGRILQVRITGVSEDGCVGELADRSV